MTQPVPALRLASVSKRYGGLHAVKDVAFEVLRGERRGLIGPNGAGKTTLFNLISGFTAVSAGKIELLGKDVTSLPPHRRVALGMARTFQITRVFPDLTVLQNAILALQGLTPAKYFMLRPLCSYSSLRKRAVALLTEWQLAGRENTPVNKLSHGEQRTLEILLGVAQRPKLLLLDEPTAGLSPAETAFASALIDKLPRDTAILLIEHDMDVALRLCDSLTVLHFGQVLASGPKQQITQDPRVQEIYLGASEPAGMAQG
jgi:branched-chain amino acid transport system ATP-binding protein